MSALDPGRIQDELPQLVDRLESEFARLFTYFRIPAQDAEDLLQDALVLFITKRPQIVSPDAWLIGTLRYRCLLYWRKRRRRLLEIGRRDAPDGARRRHLPATGERRSGARPLGRDRPPPGPLPVAAAAALRPRLRRPGSR